MDPWLLLLMGLPAVVFPFMAQYQGKRATAKAEQEKPIVIEPYDEFDPWCTCRQCYLFSDHAVEVVPVKVGAQLVDDDGPAAELSQKIRYLAGIESESAGDYTYIGTWQNPYIKKIPNWPDEGWYALRTCNMCGHTWKTHADTPKEGGDAPPGHARS